MRSGKLVPFKKFIKADRPTLAFVEDEFRYWITFRVCLDKGDNEQQISYCDHSGNVLGFPIPFDGVHGIDEDMGSSCEIYLIGDVVGGYSEDVIIRGYYCCEQAKIGTKGR